MQKSLRAVHYLIIGVNVAAVIVKSDMAGTVSKIVVQVGSTVAEDDALLIMESMKMEIPVAAPRAGRITAIHTAEGEVVGEGDVLISLDA
ncbi:MAG: acetyl-CoA carboxylase biotin carboxyl carrier protein subunit [Frankiales bacterium]|nr:acetyl-CoA carboxylase biotin carboxyl carrier protein subunit [Frankiales bacterium]